jgi:hypothetical protein
VLRGAGDPAALVEQFHARTETEIAPWYHAQMAVDRARFADIEALREGREPPPPTGLARDIRRLLSTMLADPDQFRVALEYIATITPVQDLLRRPEVVERVDAIRAALKDTPPRQLPGPTRGQLLALVS